MNRPSVTSAQVFREEERALLDARALLENPPNSSEDWRRAYGILVDNFEVLLGKTVKITRLGDSAQRKIMRVKNELEEKNEVIEARQQELMDLNEKLKEAGLTDPLTGLRNRRYLHDYLDRHAASVARVFESGKEVENRDLLFVILDIDHFKSINDRFGHGAGDQVLKKLAGLVKDICRKGDVSVRWGGEEFLLVFHDVGRDSAHAVGERIRKDVEGMPVQVEGGRTLQCTCSVGYACYPFYLDQPDLLSWQKVIQLADAALYAAKRGGRNAWVGLVPGEEGSESFAMSALRDPSSFVRKGALKIESSLPDPVVMEALTPA